MRQIAVIYFFILAMSLTRCNHDDCYHLSVQFEQDPKLENDNPVFDSNGILGFVKEFREKNGTNVATLCIFDSVKIPKNSVWMYGYIGTFATRGIQVIPSTENKYVHEGDLLQGIAKDSLSMTLPQMDTAIVEKLIDVIRDLNNSHSERKNK